MPDTADSRPPAGLAPDYGMAQILPFDSPTTPGALLTWVLFGAAHEGQGIAREAATACIAHAFDTLGWDTAVSYIAPENAASIALAERLGATLDPDAPQPETTYPILIYRHPNPMVAT